MTRPTLIVPGNPADWLPSGRSASCGYIKQADACPVADCMGTTCARPNPPALSWVPVDELPEVARWHDHGGGFSSSSGLLRAGDVVEIALWDGEMAVDYPFATATVAQVVRVMSVHEHAPNETHVSVGNDTWLWEWDESAQDFIMHEDFPGDWSSARFGVRLENVEALT